METVTAPGGAQRSRDKRDVPSEGQTFPEEMHLRPATQSEGKGRPGVDEREALRINEGSGTLISFISHAERRRTNTIPHNPGKTWAETWAVPAAVRERYVSAKESAGTTQHSRPGFSRKPTNDLRC